MEDYAIKNFEDKINHTCYFITKHRTKFCFCCIRVFNSIMKKSSLQIQS